MHVQPRRPCCTCFGRISISCGFRLRYWYWLGNRIGYIPPYFATFEKNNHVLRPCMIASKVIQDNGDRTYNVSFVLLSCNEENDQKEGFRDLKWRNGVQNRNLREKTEQNRTLLKIFDFSVKSQRLVNNQCSESTVNGWRVLMRDADTGWWRGKMTSSMMRNVDAEWLRNPRVDVVLRRLVWCVAAQFQRIGSSGGVWRRVRHIINLQRTFGSTCGCVRSRLGIFPVGFCSR